jgi:tetratricopeptide (TPR) repeat protein
LDVTLPDAERIASAIVRESEGNPFFIGELARSNRARERADRDATAEVVTLDQLVAERLTDLPDDARSIVELVAVDGRPLPVSLIAAACGRPDVYASIALAAAGRFLRMGMREGRDVLESTHDRIRENVLRLLSPTALRERHRRLAVTLEDLGQSADAEAIATHWLGADERARAAPFAERAAEAAAGKLAFEHASRLFRVALDNPSAGATDLRPLRRRLAEVLQLRGLNAESAREYLTAAEGAPPEEQIEDRRAAAEQLLAAGQLQAGSEILQGVLDTVGLRAPRGVVSALIWLIIYRIWLGLRGLRFVERNRADLSRQERLRLQALFTAAWSFAPVSLVASCMTVRYFIEALRLGDREHVLYAASLTLSLASIGGRRVSRFEIAVTELAQQAAERDVPPEGLAFHEMSLGHTMFLRMRFREAAEILERSVARLAVTKWNRTPARLFNLYALYWTGPMNEVVARHRDLLADAAERGDLLTIVTLRTLNHLLTCEEARVVRRNMDEALERWPRGRFMVQHCMAALYGVDIDLYEGQYAAGYERITRALPQLDREFITQVGLLRMEAHVRLGRLAVASIPAHPAQRKRRMAQARKVVRRLKREYEPLGLTMALLLEATIENALGNKAAALGALKSGIARAEEVDAFVLAVPARYRLGELLGGEEGKSMQMAAFQQMSAEGIRDPERWTQIFMPGAWTHQ